MIGSRPGQPAGSASPGVPRGPHSSPASYVLPSQRLAGLRPPGHEVRTRNRGSILPEADSAAPASCRVFPAADSAVTAQLLNTAGAGKRLSARGLRQKTPGSPVSEWPFLPGHATRRHFPSPLQ